MCNGGAKKVIRQELKTKGRLKGERTKERRVEAEACTARAVLAIAADLRPASGPVSAKDRLSALKERVKHKEEASRSIVSAAVTSCASGSSV